MASNSTPNSPAPHPSPATSSDSSVEEIPNVPTNSPCTDERPAATSDCTLDQAVDVPRNTPDTSFPSTTGSSMDETVDLARNPRDRNVPSTSRSTLDDPVHVPANSRGREPSPSEHWCSFYWLRELHKPAPEYAMTLSTYIESNNEENSSRIPDETSSSDSLPDTVILSQTSTSSLEVNCSPEQPSQSNRLDPDRDELPGAAAICPVESRESTRMKRKRDSSHPQERNTKKLRNETDTESPPSQSSSTVDSTADVSLVTEDKEGTSSSSED